MLREAGAWARVRFIIPLKCADALRGVLSSDGRGRGDRAGGGYAMGMGMYLGWRLCDMLIFVGDMCLGILVLSSPFITFV